jgi:hypothetical protein
MKWKLVRKQYRVDGIFGEMTSEDGKNTFFTIEHAYKIEDEHYPKSVDYFPKVQEGIHPCKMFLSKKNKCTVPLLDAPEDMGHFFEIHILNYNEESDGCIGVGTGIGKRSNGGQMITGSKDAFNLLMRVGITELEVTSVS